MVENDYNVSGSITENNEMRWYGFNLTEKSKVTMFMQTVETLDADIYMYSLNEETYQLELIGGSANLGLGIGEAYTGILDKGTYYFSISGYEGTGSYVFNFFDSIVDVEYEINDSASTASTVDFDASIYGVIDNPSDVDYYKITLSDASIIRYTLTNSSSTDYEIGYISGSGAGAKRVKGNLLALNAGTYVFAVYSPNGTYSNSNQYTAKFSNISPISTDSTATFFAVSEDANVVFQFNGARTAFYVNGNAIDFSYSYKKSMSNSAGLQSYNIELKKTKDFNVCLFQTEGTDAGAELQQCIPDVLSYHSSSFTGKSYDKVLELSVFDWNNKCYTIHNVCSGAYKGNTLWADLNCANLYIDPDTGMLLIFNGTTIFTRWVIIPL